MNESPKMSKNAARPIKFRVFNWIAAVLSGFCVALAGCVSADKILEKPRISLRSLKVMEPNASGATLVFGVLVENPNGIALHVDELIYDLEVAGRQLSSGKLAEGASVPAKNTAVVEIPVSVRYADLFTSLIQLLDEAKSPYRIKGSARVGPFQIPFDQAGEVHLPGG